MTFLGSDHLLKGLVTASPLFIGNCNEITELLSDHVDFQRMVFGVKTVSKYSVDAIFFQLVGSKILYFKKNSKGEVTCVLAKDSTMQSNYQQISFWSGFEFRSLKQGGGSISYNTLLSQKYLRNYFDSNTG